MKNIFFFINTIKKNVLNIYYIKKKCIFQLLRKLFSFFLLFYFVMRYIGKRGREISILFKVYIRSTNNTTKHYLTLYKKRN
jgi:hypothetical protein